MFHEFHISTTSDPPPAGNRGVADGDHVLQFWLKNCVEICWAAYGHQAVRVGEFRENSNLIIILKTCAYDSHDGIVVIFL